MRIDPGERGEDENISPALDALNYLCSQKLVSDWQSMLLALKALRLRVAQYDAFLQRLFFLTRRQSQIKGVQIRSQSHRAHARWRRTTMFSFRR